MTATMTVDGSLVARPLSGRSSANLSKRRAQRRRRSRRNERKGGRCKTVHLVDCSFPALEFSSAAAMPANPFNSLFLSSGFSIVRGPECRRARVRLSLFRTATLRVACAQSIVSRHLALPHFPALSGNGMMAQAMVRTGPLSGEELGQPDLLPPLSRLAGPLLQG